MAQAHASLAARVEWTLGALLKAAFLLMLFLGLLVLAGAAALLSLDPAFKMPLPARLDASSGTGLWLAAMALLVFVGLALLLAAVAAGAIRGRDAATWGLVMVVADLCALALHGLVLPGLAVLVVGLLALAAIGPLTEPAPRVYRGRRAVVRTLPARLHG